MRSFLKYPLLASITLLSGCADNFLDRPDGDPEAGVISLSGEITQTAVTRANDNGFADGDVIGVYIVDYEGNTPGKLLSQGNRGDNVRHTFDEAAYKWSSAYNLYWKDKHTPIDVYGYYPFGSPEDVNNYRFEVKTDQSRMYDDGTMGNYEASDFLWGKVDGVAPTTNVIRLPFTHRMANARVTLVEGNGFDDGEWVDTKKQVLVTNTKHESIIDLATGTVTVTGEVSPNSIIPSCRDNEWRAIVVPQTIPAGTTLFSITVNGVPYKFSKSNEEITYIAGKMNNFTIRIDKKTPSGDYTLKLISESITPWENDLVSHDASLKEYLVVNVEEPGTLEECIRAFGKDLAKIQNLKLTGKITSKDFAVMKYKMPMLSALNLKDVRIAAGIGNYIDGNSDNYYYHDNKDDEIPEYAFDQKKGLRNLILPDKLKIIGRGAFEDCEDLTGSLTIPEGVEIIEESAFLYCSSLTGILSLPSSLKQIGGSAFGGCNFTCELSLPEKLESIGDRSFQSCSNLYGNLRLPESLKSLGEGAFGACENLTGSLEIPHGITSIPYACFGSCNFGGTLKLHDEIREIGAHAFANCSFKGELILPKNLEFIEAYSFAWNNFSGNLVLPENLIKIDEFAFEHNRNLNGVIEFPSNMIFIGEYAFSFCDKIEGLVFSEGLETIGQSAFEYCFGIGRIVCKGHIPPEIMDGTFNGIAKDNFTVEVPESSVVQYKTASGWCDFKRIVAHHELVCRPAVACAIGTEKKQTLVVDAEGDWEIESKPDWCVLSQSSGNKKTEVTLTIKAYDSTSGSREGDIVFRLKGKDYTHKCHVSQYGYQYAEDQYIALQQATKGNNGGINIVILGDGYNAKDIAEGTYLNDMRQEIEYFFGIEPYTTYRDYFNVYTAFPVSTESGIGSVNTIRYNRFNTTYTDRVGLKCDYDEVFGYSLNAPTVNQDNIDQTLIIIIPNSTDYGGVTQMWSSGAAIALCPKSSDSYPYDSRGIIQHEAGGHGFGKLGDEYIYHNAFIDFCCCICCPHTGEFKYAKSLGWYDNLELTGKMHKVGWSHLIFDPRYSDIVDIFEGGYMHSRGVFRSEQNSCMNNDIPYYSTISRESIVRRIKRYAGEQFDFEDFVANDKRSVGATTRTFMQNYLRTEKHHGPIIHKGRPLRNIRNSREVAKYKSRINN